MLNFYFIIMQKYIFLILLFSSITGMTYAHELNGIITAEESDKPIEGVGVYNKNTGAYTYTNISGYFELDDISVGDVIYFYRLGYENYELVISENNLDASIDVVLRISPASLDQVLIVSKVNVLSTLAAVDLKTNPVKSSQEILRTIPGLIIGQHAGGGKAEQIFLRGFDIDHGTDIAINVDGMPVNMVSHAHGQGYADMHFIIPETIDNIDFGKGTYYADKGNFNTAGYIDINTKKSIDKSLISLEAGQFNSLRALGMIKLIDEGKISNSIASQKLFPLMLESDKSAAILAEEHSLIQEGDSDALMDYIKAAIEAYPAKAAEYKSGKKGLLGLFMGEVMKRSGGKADPKKTNALLREELEK